MTKASMIVTAAAAAVAVIALASGAGAGDSHNRPSGALTLARPFKLIKCHKYGRGDGHGGTNWVTVCS